MNKKLYIRTPSKRYSIFFFLFFAFSQIHAQQQNFGIGFQFVNKNTSQGLDEVAGNVLRIKNNTRTPQELIVNISIPEDWQLLGAQGKKLTVAAGDSAFVPVRIIPSKSSKGSTNYVVNAFLNSDDGFQLANDYWYIDIKKISQWNMLLPQKKIYFTNKQTEAEFEVVIQNAGNSDEDIFIELSPSRNLVIIGENSEKLTNEIRLFAGKDTVLTYRVIKKEERKRTHPSTENETQRFSVKVTAENRNDKSKLWRGNVDFFQLSNEMEMEGHGHSTLPITIELNTYDILENTSMTLDIYGAAEFNNNRSLSYRYQTSYVDNFLDPKRYIGDFHYLGYFSDRGAIEIGDVSGGKHGAYIGGKGVRGTVRIKKNETSAMFVRNPEFFRGHFQTGASLNNLYRTSNFANDTYVQQRWDEFSKINSTIASNAVDFRFKKVHMVKAGIGGSFEDHYSDSTKNFKVFGASYEFGYSGKIKKLHVLAHHRYGTKNYTAYRGVNSVTSSLTYDINKKYDISFLFSHHHQHPEIYSRGIRMPFAPEINKQSYELKFSMNTTNAKIMLRPYYIYHDVALLKTATKGAAFDYRPSAMHDFKFYSTVDAAFVKALNTSLSNFFIAQVFANFRYRNMAASVRYYYGPYQILEQIRFIQTGENPQKLVISPYFDYWILPSKFLLKVNGNLNYQTTFNRINFLLRPELFYYTKADFTFSFYAEYLVNSQTVYNPGLSGDGSEQKNKLQDFNIGAGIKKSFGIPLSRKNFHDAEIIIFKDVNGSGAMENNEEAVENMLVHIKNDPATVAQDTSLTYDTQKQVNYELITDKNGKVKFENIPTGIYVLRVQPLMETGGWFDDTEITEVIDGKKKIFIPLTKAARLTGSISLERDKYSKFEGVIDLSRIRITATNSAGKTTSTLTGKNGEFSMFLPVGEYNIEINRSALGESFEFVQSQVKISLADANSSYSISFYVREKKRTMNIKEFKE